MFTPEEQQIEICLLKSNLEEIENDLVGQRSALPALDSENDQKYRDTLSALRVARSLNSEMERLKMDNVRLTAKSMQLKQHSDALSKAVKDARSNSQRLVESLDQEEQEVEHQIRKYEDSLQEISERFRKTRRFYNEEEMVVEISEVNNRIVELEGELGRRQSVVNELKQQFNEIKPEVPDDFLLLMGKNQLDDKVKSLMEKFEILKEKRNRLKCQSSKEEKSFEGIDGNQF